MTAPLLCSILIVLCGIGVGIILRPRNVVEFALSPPGLFSAYYVLVYLVSPILMAPQEATSRWGLMSGELSTSSAWALICGWAYYVAALGGMRATGASTEFYVQADACQSAQGSPRFMVIVVWAALYLAYRALFGSLLSLTDVPLLSSQMTDGELMSDSISLTAGTGYLLLPRSMGPVLEISFLILILDRRSPGMVRFVSVIAFVALCASSVVGYLAAGRRLGVVYFVIYSGLCGLLLCVRRVKIHHLLLASCVALVLLAVVSFLGNLRTEVMGGLRHGEAREKGVTWAEIQRELANSMGHAELLAFAIENESSWEPMWGATYAAALTMPVPRKWWPDKPLGAGPHMVNIIRPGSYVVGKRMISSVTTGGALEAYMNFREIGVIVVGFLHGVAVSLVSRYGRSVRQKTEIPICVLLLLSVCVRSVTNEFVGEFTALGGILFFGVLVHWSSGAFAAPRDATPRHSRQIVRRSILARPSGGGSVRE